MRASRRWQSRARALSVLVALLIGLVDLMGFAHQAAEQHAVCAEHGELVHGERSADPMLPDAPHEEEEHCRLCPGTLDGVATLPDAPGLAGRPVVTARPRPVVPVVPDSQILTRAPKTSPPLA